MERLVAALRGGARAADVVGCDESFAAYLIARLAAEAARERPDAMLVAVAADLPRARALADDARFYLGESEAAVVCWPAAEVSPFDELAPDRALMRGRLSVLSRLQPGGAVPRPRVLVVPAPALARTVEAPAALAARTVELEVAGEVDRDALTAALVAGGYEPEPVVEDPGTFAARGHLVDVYSPLYPDPVRVELLEILVESLRFFDPATQRTVRKADRVAVPPVREEDRSPAGLARIAAALYAAADAVDFPSRDRRALVADLEARSPLFAWWTFAPASHAATVPLLAHLAPGRRDGGEDLWLAVEPADCARALAAEHRALGEGFKLRRARGGLCLPPEAYEVAPETVADALASVRMVRTRMVAVGGVPVLGPASAAQPGAPAAEPPPPLRISAESNLELRRELDRARTERQHDLLAPFADAVRARRAAGERCVLTASSHANEERLEGVLQDYGLRIARAGSLAAVTDPAPPALARADDSAVGGGGAAPGSPAGDVDLWLVRGKLGRGFRLPGTLSLFAEEEVLGRRVRRRAAARAAGGGAEGDDRGVFLQSWRELKQGDLCVHLDHGICAYRGLVTIEVPGPPDPTPFKRPVPGLKQDFLHLEFAGGDKLYVPVYRLGRVQRYAGADAAGAIALDRLGGTAWDKTKRRVRESLRQMAEELIRLHAARKVQEGYALGAPDHGYREFEALFPFEETPDQLKAIEDTLADLQRPTPTDRLVCGDVGFGKTEVAMRAAYLAVAEKKQVAVLCPTTVLAQQHLLTFRARFGAIPVRIEVLSRFRTALEAKAVLKDLAAGRVDIVIGTHRLLSEDVVFADLGLVIVDEEQRFGVAHKERLKQLRETTHVLTLAATPIPRTLHMSLMGLRDLSIIATPPDDRQAIRTFVVKQSDEVVRTAIEKELARQGQVFYVRNRVEGIEEAARHVRSLVPAARVAVGHGQLAASTLENVMTEFVAGRFDVLVCTTIIESGLDIPNANTLVVERADAFGLSQLYQIRGRVGRSAQRGYAYLLVAAEAGLSADARKRLDALERFTDLGAGFSIASYDLEIRGAGNMLGAQQSGHIEAVGFDLYMQLMEETVAEIRGQQLKRRADPELKVDLEYSIPADYVGDTGQRLMLYKRLASVETEDGLDEIEREMGDRYGTPVPAPVSALVGLMAARLTLKRLGVRVLELSGTRVGLIFGEDPALTPEQAVALCNAPRTPWRLSPDGRLSRALPATHVGAPAPRTPAERIEALRRVLRDLIEYGTARPTRRA
ncbi:MAG TPA: transcription-repair coupling factor [Myxococcota bacterium]|nr:transcription-repair coupling factor [Myxococcota bacterium]